MTADTMTLLSLNHPQFHVRFYHETYVVIRSLKYVVTQDETYSNHRLIDNMRLILQVIGIQFLNVFFFVFCS